MACNVTGAMLCGIGFLSAVVVGMLDKHGVRQLGQEFTLRQDSKKLVTFTLSLSIFVRILYYVND